MITPVDRDIVCGDVARALEEDLGSGDLTAALIPLNAKARATIISREPAILCGSAWAEETFRALDPNVHVHWLAGDGEEVYPAQAFCEIEGKAQALLSGERTALNFLQIISGTATVARTYAERIQDLPTQVLDTRKTVPGLRAAQKYAVACGGCRNHRRGLFDALLIKENHIRMIGSVAAAVMAARRAHPNASVEIEVENLEQAREAFGCGVDVVLLDNFDLSELRAAVALNGGRVKLEVSGGVTLERLRELAETGVDYVSVGALTKNVRAIDLSMLFA